MSDKQEKQDKPQYSVEEILAEYGSGKYAKRPKVVEFPEPAPAPKTEEPPKPSRLKEELSVQDRKPPRPEKEPFPQADEPIPEIVPKGLGRKMKARLHTILRRADHYADHMYDQAEPDEATKRAEKYIPGVDREEVPEEDEPPRRFRRPKEKKLPPDTPPAELAAKAKKGWRAQGRRMKAAVLLSLAAVAGSLELSFIPWADWAGKAGMEVFQLRCLALTGVLLVVGLLCLEVLVTGMSRLITLRPRAESLVFAAWAFTLADGLTAPQMEGRAVCLPCSAVTALGLAFALWGEHERRHGDRLSARAAAPVQSPYIITLDDNKWSGRPAYCKWSGPAAGFGSQLQMEDAGQRAYRLAAPLLLLGGLLCAVMASTGQDAPERFVWSASACFTATSSWSALLAYGLPYRKLAVRLHKLGAALAGWPGAARCGQGGVIVSDQDLFPTGSVSVAKMKVFGGAATEKVVAYTATMLRVMDCGLTRPFHDLLRAKGAFYREMSGLRWDEGGASGIIRRQEVLVGTAAYMHLSEVAMPSGYNIKNALFCAIDGHLAGMFLLDYTISAAVNPSLSALMHSGVSPVLATRDPNLIPALLEQKFKLPVDKLEFPPVGRRLELSRREQEHDDTLVAVLSREGLAAYCDAVVGGRRLRSAAIWGLCFALGGAVVGLCLTFYLTSIAAYASLTAANFLLFMALWLVPEVLIANWVNQY